MAFVWLENLLHNRALPQKVCQTGHVEWIQHVDFEKIPIADIIAVEGDTLDESDVSNEDNFFLVHIAAIADCKGMVDG